MTGYPRLTIDLGVIAENTRLLAARLRGDGFTLVGVTKCVDGEPRVGQALLEAGCAGLADSRLPSLARLAAASLAPLTLIRAPQPDEAAACGQYLLRQLQIIRPKVIVTLGNPSTQYLLKTTIGITKIRGNWHKLPPLAPGLAGIAVMPTFHPAYLLRNYTPQTRKEVWDDLRKVMPALGLKPKRMGK
jgi:hypothetical protein